MLEVHSTSVRGAPAGPWIGRALGTTGDALVPGSLGRVYFAFDYGRGLARVRRIRNVPGFIANAAAGFNSPELWEQVRRKGGSTARSLIDGALDSTVATVVCLGRWTGHGKFLRYELERSRAHGNGIVGNPIHVVPDGQGRQDESGREPFLIRNAGFNIYDYRSPARLAAAIHEAIDLAQASGDAPFGHPECAA